MIVIAASAILELLLCSIHRHPAEWPSDCLRATIPYTPHIYSISGSRKFLRRYTLAGEMEAERSEQSLEDLADLPLHRYPHDVFLFRI